MARVPLPTSHHLLEELDRTTHAARCRRVATLAVNHHGDPALAAVLDGVAAESDYHHILTLLAAEAIHDEPRLHAALDSPSPQVRLVAAGRVDLRSQPHEVVSLYLRSSAAVRAVLRQRFRRDRMTEVVETLCGADVGDAERAGLLASAGPATVERLLPDLADLVPNVEALARGHAVAVLDHLERSMAGATRSVRRHWWQWATPALAHLSLTEPDRVLELLEHHGPDSFLPGGLDRTMGFLTRHDPARVVRLMCDVYFDHALPHSMMRSLRRLAPADRLRLLRRAPNSWHQRLVFDALPPSERPGLFAAFETAVGPDACVAVELMDTLPKELRFQQGRRLLARRGSDRPETRLRRAAGLPFEEAEAVAEPFLHSSLSAERAEAYRCLLESAGRCRDPRSWTAALHRLAGLRNEHDAVRQDVAVVLTRLPAGVVAQGPSGPIHDFVGDVAQDRSSSSGTTAAARELCWRVVQWCCEQDRTETARRYLAALNRFMGATGDLRVPDLTRLPRRREELVIEAFLPRIRAQAEQLEYGLLVHLAAALGRRLSAHPEIQSLLEPAFAASDQHLAERAMELWLDDPGRRGDRVEQLLQRDPSAVTRGFVQAVLLRDRQDLLDRCWSRTPPEGRFWVTPKRFVALLPTRFRGVLPRQLRDYAAALRDLANDNRNEPQRLAAIAATVGRIPGIDPGTMEGFLGSPYPEVVEAALGSVAPAGGAQVVDLLLRYRGTSRARVASHALGGALHHLPPADLGRVISTMLGSDANLTTAKAGLRLLGRLRPPGALDMLLAAVGPHSHRDVRIAMGRALQGFLDDERAWQALEQQARASRDEAWALVATAAQRLPVRQRPRYAALIHQAVQTWPETTAKCGGWLAWRPCLAEALHHRITDLDSSDWENCAYALAMAVSRGDAWPQSVRLVDELASGALAPDQPNATTERDLPRLQRVKGLCRLLLRSPDNSLAEHRSEMADVLARHPATRSMAFAAAAASVDRAHPEPGLRRLLDLIDDPLDARRPAGSVRRMRWFDTSLENVARAAGLDLGDGAAAGLLRLELIEVGGRRTEWAQPWRDMLREMRHHPSQLVVEAALHTTTAPE